MSIMIKGMKMPKNCYQCRMVDSCQYLWKPYDLDDYSDLQDMIEEGFTRADNCPLVEVPPHGRLIDADELYKEALNLSETKDGYYNWLDPVISCYTIDNAPTIIPADKERT